MTSGPSATDLRRAVGERAWCWHAAGGCPVPVRDDGSKAPVGAWKRYQAAPPGEAEMVKMFGPRDNPWRSTGFGLVLRNGLECLETEDRATEALFVAYCVAAGLGDLLARVTRGYADRGPGGGVHRLYSVTASEPGAEPDGNTKLAQRREFSPKEASKLAAAGLPECDADGHNQTLTLAETRGFGGFIICAPSGSPMLHPGKPARYANRSDHDAGRELHARIPAGRFYEDISGSPETVVTITRAEREALCAVARTLDEMPQLAPQQHYGDRAARARAAGASTIGDWFNQAVSWDHVMVELLGWRPAGQGPGAEQHWLRPGDTTAQKSATSDYEGNDHLTVFSTSVEWAGDPKPGTAAPSYDRFGVVARARHGGDFTAAARWVAASYAVPAEVRAASAATVVARSTPCMPGGSLGGVGAATPAEVEEFLRAAQRYTRPKALGRRVAWMLRDGVGARHAIALVEEAARGYYPARRALGVLRAAHRRSASADPSAADPSAADPSAADPAAADGLFVGALGVVLHRRGVAR